ncbi:MAG: MFS transporter [Chloroflexota bacterium]
MAAHRAGLPAPQPGRATGALASLGYRDFRLLWLGFGGALIGFWMYQVAQSWLVLRLTNSPLWVGVAAAASNLPFLILGLLGGVVADRVDRRRLLLVARGLMALLTGGLGVLTLTGQVAVWHVLVVGFLTGVLWSFELPARQAMVPELVGREALFNAVSLMTVAVNGTRIVGPALGGLLVAAWGEGGAIAVYAVGNVAMVVMVAMMEYRPPRTSPKAGALVRDAVEGVGYMWREKDVRALVGQAAGIGMWSAAYQTLLPVFVRDVYGGGAGELGLLLAAAGLGALAISVLLALRGDFPRKGLWVLLTAAAFGATQVLLALAPGQLGGAAALVGIGAAQTVHSALTTTLILLVVPSGYHGRLMSAMGMTWGLSLVGSIAVGALAEVFGAPVAMAVSGLACLAVR